MENRAYGCMMETSSCSVREQSATATFRSVLANARDAFTRLNFDRDEGRSNRMARRLVDISVALQAGIASDPPYTLPQIEYRDHHMTAPAIAAYFGVSLDQLPNGEYAA